MLLALFLGVAEACAALDALYAHTGAECGAISAYDVLVGEFKGYLVLCLLAPLDEFALEVVVLLGYLVELYVCTYDALFEETVAVGVATVEVDGTYQGFEGVARDETVVCVIDVGRLYELYQAYLLGYAVEAATLHYLAAYGGEEALFLALEMMVEDVAHHGLNDGIAQVLKTFVVFLVLVRTMVVERTMHQCLTVYVKVVGVETEYVAQLTGKGLVGTTQVVDIVGE